MNIFGKAVYGLLDLSTYGVRIISGIVTGISYTEDLPIYEISFGNDKWRTSRIFHSEEELLKGLNLNSLDKIQKTHQLKIKYNL